MLRVSPSAMLCPPCFISLVYKMKKIWEEGLSQDSLRNCMGRLKFVTSSAFVLSRLPCSPLLFAVQPIPISTSSLSVCSSTSPQPASPSYLGQKLSLSSQPRVVWVPISLSLSVALDTIPSFSLMFSPSLLHYFLLFHFFGENLSLTDFSTSVLFTWLFFVFHFHFLKTKILRVAYPEENVEIQYIAIWKEMRTKAIQPVTY